jgi:Arf-GAP/SH3 domain/ANK repeat/PH domain-containing protein
LLLKLPTEDELNLIFTFTIRRKEETAGTASVSTTINGLTFITASNAREIDNLVTREFHADPNLHKNPNVNLVGDYSTDGSNAVQFDYKWRWRPPQGLEDKVGIGWRNTCSVCPLSWRTSSVESSQQLCAVCRI